MPIRRYLEPQAVFAPEALAIMNRAFAIGVWRLGISSDRARREALAASIVLVARYEPNLNAQALSERAIWRLLDSPRGISAARSQSAQGP